MYKNKQKKDINKNIIIMILIIIIIILLLHNCVLEGRKKDKNRIDICDGSVCQPANAGLKINCLEDIENSICVIPNFRGKTEKDIQEWLDKISNNIEITYQVYDSEKMAGLVIDQSNEQNITIKDLLDNNISLTIMFANSRNTKVDCLEDIDNELCEIPNFKGKTKKDVYEWLNQISNSINTNFVNKMSDEKGGTIINQSIKVGTKVKDILDEEKILSITFSNIETVDCLNDDNNPICLVPNFTGSTQKEVEEWLSSISNIISVNYKTEISDLKSDTVLIQSAKPGTSIKKLINSNTPLSITFAKTADNSKADCLKNVNDSRCKLPDFSGMTKEDVERWLSLIGNNIPIRYETVTSNTPSGIIINQSINSGTTVKDILNSNNQLVISISKKPIIPTDVINPINIDDNNDSNNNNDNNDNQEPEPTEDPIPDEEKGQVVVKDKDVTWETDTVVDIFNNSLANTLIAPESSNTYRFTVYNNTSTTVKYDLTFTEINESNINMKYKLRKNNTYIISDYSSISELNLTEQVLNSDKNDVFYLEWKWVSSDNDTEIGASRNATYNLKIKVEAEEIVE